jgi:hypothetical protein
MVLNKASRKVFQDQFKEQLGGNFLKGSGSLKNAYTGKTIGEKRAVLVGTVIYGICSLVGVYLFIIYLTLPGFKIEKTTITPVMLEGQNCTLLGAYTGTPYASEPPAPDSRQARRLGGNYLSETSLKYSMDGLIFIKMQMAWRKTLSPGTSASFKPEESNTCAFFKQQPTGPTISNDYIARSTGIGNSTMQTRKAFFQQLETDYPTKLDSIQLARDVLDIVQGNTGQFIGSDFHYTQESTTVDVITAYTPEFTIDNSYKNTYYPSESICNEELQLLSADLEITEKTILFEHPTSANATTDGWDEIIHLEGFNTTSIKDEVCNVPIKAAQINFKFNKPGFRLSFGPAVGTDNFMTNLVCSQAYIGASGTSPINKNNAAKCGLQTEEAFIGSYNGEKTVKVFNALFPKWRQQVCSEFVYPPYQCTTYTQPSLVDAFGNALAIWNAMLGWAFLAATHLLIRGYWFHDDSDNDDDENVAADSGSADKKDIELVEAKNVGNPIASGTRV